MRPVITLLHIQNSKMFFILDGHHKFCTYGRSNVEPHAIIITKLGNEYKFIEETIELAITIKCDKTDYFYWMEREKKN